MAPVLAAEVWHYWVGVALFGGAVLAAISTLAGYLKLQSTKFPRRSE
ncbi:MAG: hypothetical protein WA797_12370 [Acidimicrobiales bacterium]|nr:hypothetical protein [Actinomycetota bacterium]MBI3257496.1 hypothetical protein [Actinomycetota bacterium]